MPQVGVYIRDPLQRSEQVLNDIGIRNMPVDGVRYIRLHQVVQDTLKIESVVGQVIDTCKFTVHDKYGGIDTGPSVILPTMADIIVVRELTEDEESAGILPVYEDDESAGSANARLFGGLCALVLGEPEGFSRYWHVSAQDYTILLDRSLCLNNYPADFKYPSLKDGPLVGTQALLAAAFNRDVVGEGGVNAIVDINATATVYELGDIRLPGFSIGDVRPPGTGIGDEIHYIEQGLDSLAQQLFRYATLREVVAQLAQYVGFDYYVDYHRNLHFYYRENARAAPYALTDGDISAPDGTIGRVNVADGGSGYDPDPTNSPRVMFDNTGTGGSGAAGTAVVDSSGEVIRIDIVDPGSGYTSVPIVMIDASSSGGPQGRDATATAVLGMSNRNTEMLNYRECMWRRDGTRLVNTFALFGDRLLADGRTEVFGANGSQRTFNLNSDTVGLNIALVPTPGNDAIGVLVNTGEKSIGSPQHDGANGASAFFDSNGNFMNDGVVIGDIIYNETDGSYGVIVNVTRNQITGRLRGGVNNSWATDDVAIVPTWNQLTVTNDATSDNPLGTHQVYHEPVQQRLTFASAPPNSPIAIQLRFTYTFAAGQVESDSASVVRYGGRIFSRRLVVSDVNSIQGLTTKLGHLLEQYADALEVVTIKVTDDMFPNASDYTQDDLDLLNMGRALNDQLTAEQVSRRRFQAGQWVTFTNNNLNDPWTDYNTAGSNVVDRLVDKEFLIYRMTTRILGVDSDHGPLLEYELELRNWEVDII